MSSLFNNRPLPIILDLPQPGLLNFINQFGDLWIGTLPAEYYKEQFCERKQHLLDNITSYVTDDQCDNRIIDSNFRLMMIRTALNEQWRQPGFIHYNQTPTTGNSRILASGLCHFQPWNTFNFLVFAPNDASITQIVNPTKVVNENQLWQILGLDKNPKDLITQILLDCRPDSARPTKIDLVFTNYSLYNKGRIQPLNDYVRNYQCWQRQYKTQNNKFNIGIITDWPELVSDTNNCWNVTIIGPSRQLTQCLVNPGNFEKLAWNEHHDKSIDIDHVLWIKSPRKIDLAEFLFWIDLEHTTYIDQHWNFILYRRDQNYKSQYVSLSNF